MRLRSWVILTIAFGSLLALLCVSEIANIRRSRQVYARLLALNDAYRRNEESLHQIRAGISESSLYVRDYLLDPTYLRDDYYRAALRRFRQNTSLQLEAVRQLSGAENAAAIADLTREVNAYWESLKPVFQWTPVRKRALSYIFLRNHVMPRRDSVLKLVALVEEVNKDALERQKLDIAQSERDFKNYAKRTLSITELLGLLIAIVCIHRVLSLERRSDAERRRAEQAEAELRTLSNQIVRAQEAERKAISRELHDEVGQMLTGLRMEFRALGRLHNGPPERFQARIEEGKALLDRTLQAVRDIAMGLRPSMLDDLGLGPALEWQARDFSRRYDVPVTLALDEPLDGLPEHHRTNIFRIVQEALTNCARHARARSVSVTVRRQGSELRLLVADDGVGMDAAQARRGLGLMGIQERARELSGALTIDSSPGKGTRLLVRIPEPRSAPVHAGEPA
jgi:signal transduction histidine kinase